MSKNHDEILSSSKARSREYRKEGNTFTFINPAFQPVRERLSNRRASVINRRGSVGVSGEGAFGLKDFLASMPSFSNFSDQQLSKLEKNAITKSFRTGDIIFTQGDEGDVFYVIHKGEVDILVQERVESIGKGDLGRVVNRLTEGYFFGERALMTDEPRAATIRCVTDTECLVFTRAVFEDVISGSNALIGIELVLFLK